MIRLTQDGFEETIGRGQSSIARMFAAVFTGLLALLGYVFQKTAVVDIVKALQVTFKESALMDSGILLARTMWDDSGSAVLQVIGLDEARVNTAAAKASTRNLNWLAMLSNEATHGSPASELNRNMWKASIGAFSIEEVVDRSLGNKGYSYDEEEQTIRIP